MHFKERPRKEEKFDYTLYISFFSIRLREEALYLKKREKRYDNMCLCFLLHKRAILPRIF